MAGTRSGIQKPKTGKGVFPPEGTPDTEGGLWDLFNLILNPLNAMGGMGGGETVAPKGQPAFNPAQSSSFAPTTPPSTTAMAGSVGQTPQMAAQPTDTMMGQAAPTFDLGAVFGDAFQGMSDPGMTQGMPNPTPNPISARMNPPQPNPNRMLMEAVQSMTGGGQGLPPMPEPNPALHDDDMLRQVFASLGG